MSYNLGTHKEYREKVHDWNTICLLAMMRSVKKLRDAENANDGLAIAWAKDDMKYWKEMIIP